MIAQLLLVFRESLESIILVAIMLAYTRRTAYRQYEKYLWYGIIIALVVSAGLGVALLSIYGVLPPTFKPLFEGGASLIAVGVLSWMIFWMAKRGGEMKTEIAQKLDTITSTKTPLALTLFAFIAVFREGLETVLFLSPYLGPDPLGTVIGLILGIIGALIIGVLIFSVGLQINLQRFFYYSSILLILVAGGLAGYGVHELFEFFELAGVSMGWIAEAAYILPIPSTSIFHHKGLIGSIFAVFLGYSVAPEWGRVFLHFGYILIVLPLIIRIYQSKKEHVVDSTNT